MYTVGVTLVMRTIVSFVLALQYGEQTAPWNADVAIGPRVSFFLTMLVLPYQNASRADAQIISCGFAVNSVGSYYLVIHCLPIYSQSVSGSIPTMSGVYNLTLIIASTVPMIVSGMAIRATGYVVRLLLALCGIRDRFDSTRIKEMAVAA
ncbi:hypothetical protein MMYC01_209286 [Madurella mycetomatis]|uniref:Uncharacterized protein n=1 Tax=Madurella mycetomatis TaxID=100816 RepID=A0A175VVI7_9PEZI|nr:hypothetical protein MMYC01_209286 [Madurella mycetomatis]